MQAQSLGSRGSAKQAVSNDSFVILPRLALNLSTSNKITSREAGAFEEGTICGSSIPTTSVA